MWFLASNTMVVFLIVFIDMVRAIIKWIKVRCQKDSNNGEDLNQIALRPSTRFGFISNPNQEIINERSKDIISNQRSKILREESKFDISNPSEIHIMNKR